MGKKKTYVLTVSTVFPAKHRRAGEQTKFIEFIHRGLKIHTIRGNYELWKKRIDEINRGEAILSVRFWSGRPYHTKQTKVLVHEKVGIQKIQLKPFDTIIDDRSSDVSIEIVAQNDGLSLSDFRSWFKNADPSKPMAIIHFTDFRYE